MHIDKGIDIKNGVKSKCTRCKSVLAIRNDVGQIFLRKVSVGYISIYENICEIKCKDCGQLNNFDYIGTNEIILKDEKND